MPQANDIFLGQAYKLQMGTGSPTITYNTIANQINGSITQSQTKVEIVNKDTVSRKYRSTSIERTVSITGHIDYSETHGLRELNAAFATQAQDKKSIPFKFLSDVPGQDNYAFLAIIDRLEMTMNNDEAAEFTLEMTIDGDMTVTVVA